MFTRRLASFLQIRPGESLLVALVAGLFACLEAGRGLGANAADALFFLRFGVNNLPYMFMLLGAANFLASLSYAAGLGRFDKRRFFSLLPGALAVVLLAEWMAIRLNWPALYPLLWITVNIIGSVLGLTAWNIASEVCDARQAKRLFSLFASAGILGGVAGNFITGPLARAIGAENLLVLYGALLLVELVLAHEVVRRFFRPGGPRITGRGFLREVRAGLDFVRRSPLLKLMAVSAVLFSILYFSIAFPFSKAVSSAFPNEAGVAGFLGTFSGIATAITFGVSLFIANRLYARIGVVNSVLLFPVTYLLGFVLLAVDYSLAAAASVRLAQLVVLGGIAATAYNTFFNVVPVERRGQVRSFDSGVPEQIGVALSGALLLLGERALAPAQIFVMGMIVALACGVLVWRMRERYGDALLAALRAGRYEVFTDGARAFARLQGNADAIRAAAGALRDPRPSTRRLAIDILARMRAVSALPALLPMLKDPEAEVRAEALKALGDLDAHDAAHAAATLLGDADAGVRATALRVLPGLLLDPRSPDEHGPHLTPSLLAAVEAQIGHPDHKVQAEAAIALAKLGAPDQALRLLNTWLRDTRPDTRVLALEALAQIDPVKIDFQTVVGALSDEWPRVRGAACRVLARARPDLAIDPLVERLCDPDAPVRAAAAAALKSLGVTAAPRVREVLRGEHSLAADAALDALMPDAPDLPEVLLEYARREIDRACHLRDIAAAIPQTGRMAKLLRATLEARVREGEQRLVKTVGLLGNREAMEQVGKSLKTRDAQARAAAIEALETLGHPLLARQIIPLFDDAPPDEPQPVEAAIQSLLAAKDNWLRALAAAVAGELRLQGVAPGLRALASDSDPLARDAARHALHALEGVESMETLQTVSTMERILLLREVPLFAELSPDDLKQIADIAREQFYAGGAIIAREGEYGSEMFILVAGRVKVVKQLDRSEKLVAARGAGDILGEMTILESAPRMASVRADGEVRVLAIEGEAFKSILRDRPEVALAVLRVLSRRLREKE